jgi:hypothetical protein
MTTNSLLYTTFESGVYGGIGYVYATQMKLPVNLTASILVLSRVADRVIQELCKSLAEVGNRRSVAELTRVNTTVYIATNILVNTCTIMALRHFDLVALKGTLILSSLAYVNVIGLLNQIP